MAVQSIEDSIESCSQGFIYATPFSLQSYRLSGTHTKGNSTTKVSDYGYRTQR